MKKKKSIYLRLADIADELVDMKKEIEPFNSGQSVIVYNLCFQINRELDELLALAYEKSKNNT